ncbi:hypothetical protein HaLaN_07996 [Haematococcus lacustris]|uniref:Uncharacterized protein n=1 Tax=Haematococcus lacustris TaxID=44745 RepID=A0A699YSS1_HAELA|nr:hypothetical protein HaLaN_07996 [Haematococcus lacustris]
MDRLLSRLSLLLPPGLIKTTTVKLVTNTSLEEAWAAPPW